MRGRVSPEEHRNYQDPEENKTYSQFILLFLCSFLLQPPRSRDFSQKSETRLVLFFFRYPNIPKHEAIEIDEEIEIHMTIGPVWYIDTAQTKANEIVARDTKRTLLAACLLFCQL